VKVPSPERLWRAHEVIGSVPIALWLGFHLWEQWAAFAGRDAWAERMGRTSLGPIAIATEVLLAILPALVWIALEAHLRISGPEPGALRLAMAEDAESARRLGLLARVASWVFFVWVLHHASWLWWPKLASGAEPLRAWVALRAQMGALGPAIWNAIGLVTMAVHLWAAVPRTLAALEWTQTPEGRRAARLCGLVLGAFALVLYAQLAGWHASGRGTIWPLPGTDE
jgi:hypothetical protein